MKGLLLKYIIVFALVMFSGSLLMDVSHRVQSVERDIKSHDRKIAREKEAIRVLKAEWAYLNDPVRLESLVAWNLDLISPEVAKLISDMRSIPEVEPDSSIFIPARSPLHRDISYVPSARSSSLSPVQAKSLHIIKPISFPNDGGAQ